MIITILTNIKKAHSHLRTWKHENSGNKSFSLNVRPDYSMTQVRGTREKLPSWSWISKEHLVSGAYTLFSICQNTWHLYISLDFLWSRTLALGYFWARYYPHFILPQMSVVESKQVWGVNRMSLNSRPPLYPSSQTNCFSSLRLLFNFKKWSI